MKEKFTHYSLIVIFLLLLYLVLKMVWPFFNYILTGLILTIASYPAYKWLLSRIKRKKLSSIIVIILILLLIIIPSSLVIGSLVIQTKSFVDSFDQASVEKATGYFNNINSWAVSKFGDDANLKDKIGSALQGMEKLIINSTASLLGSIAEVILGLFVMFFIMYYGLIEGKKWLYHLREHIHIPRDRKEKLVKQVAQVTHAVIFGQILIALIQGVLGGIGFFIVGIKNPVFWGFVMTILAFIPVTGTGFVWIPAGIIELVNSNILGGIFLLVYGFVIVSSIDNFIRPRIISGKSNIHPAIALVGVLGGLKVFGFMGIFIGPFIASLFIGMAGFLYEDYLKQRD